MAGRRIIREPGFWVTGAAVSPVAGYSVTGASFVWLPVVAGLWLMALLLVGALWLALARPPWYLDGAAARRKFRWRRGGAAALWAVVVVSIPVTRWPVRLALLVSRPALNKVADRVERGERLRYPVRAGLFVIREAKMSDLDSAGYVAPVSCLWVDDYGTRFSNAGFVRGAVRDGSYCCFSVSRLSGNWSQMDED